MSKLFIVATVAALFGSLARAQSPAAAPADVRLYTLECARMRTNGILASDPCFLIRHPKGDLLWDLGLPRTLAGAPGEVAKIGNAEIMVGTPLTEMLAQLGMTPADVEYVSVSHTHVDHAGNLGLFTTATGIVDADEREWAFRPAARLTPAFASYRALEQSPMRLIEGDADADVFGDGRVRIIQAPGHTPGHTILLVQLSEAGTVLLVGDMWNTADARTARRGTPQALASMDRVEAIAAQTGARVVRHHVTSKPSRAFLVF